MGEQILAAVGLGACLLLIVRLLLSAPRQRRFDATARQIWYGLKDKSLRVWFWRKNRRAAEQAAHDAINRANQKAARRGNPEDGSWKGNVYESKSFRKPRKPH